MDSSAALTARLDDLVGSVGLGPGWLTDPLAALSRQLRRVIPSYLGLVMTTDDLGQRVIVTAFTPGARAFDIATSLWLAPASMRSTPSGSGTTFYASTRGAFLDLAAQLTDAWPRHQPDGWCGPPPLPVGEASPVRLDAVPTPVTVVSTVTGVVELATINRAVGRLIDEGHDQPEQELFRRAAGAGLSTHTYAVGLLERRPGSRSGQTSAN